MQLQYLEFNAPQHPKLKKLSTIYELRQGLVRPRKSIIYPLVDKSIGFMLIVPFQ